MEFYYNHKKLEYNKFRWEQINPGYVIAIGIIRYGISLFKNEEIRINCWWTKIAGYLVMFYDTQSWVIDYRLIDKWLKENLSENSYKSKTDCANFHNTILSIEERLKKDSE